MRELSLHLLDLAQNAAAAVAGMDGARVVIRLMLDEGRRAERRKESPCGAVRQPDPLLSGRGRTQRSRSELLKGADARRLTFCVADNGCGMTARQAQKAQSPFYTARPARGSGLGIPLCKAAALRTGGAFSLQSAPGCGACVTAVFCLGHIDCAPLGDLPETLAAIVGCHPEIAFTVSARVLSAGGAAAKEEPAAGTAAAHKPDGSGTTAWEAAKGETHGGEPAANKPTAHKPAGSEFLAEEAALRALTCDFAPGDARALVRLKQYFKEKLSLFLQKGEQNMKSLEELAAIRDKMKQTVETREAAHDATRVTVGMGTGGIAAGARGVLNAFAKEVSKNGLHGVLVTQTGSIGPAGREPVVEVVRAGEQKVTYVKMTPEKAARVVAEHLAGGTPVAEYTIENAQ